MAPLKTAFLAAALLGAGAAGHGSAQTAAGGEAAGFASENAILDTALPFAIGAREARQSLRGAFGWPTFQEGLVEGVYFRFDPDGYARFAPTPRLDTDVFEVICRPRTYSCMGRKGDLSLMLNSRGQHQLKIDGVQQGDLFFISEGVNEIQVPDRILQPLDIQMETLLATGNELTVRRGDNQIAQVSLKGFPAVAAYLRWVAARQDYSVLPRGWPVPNSMADDAQGTMTQAGNWASPMPQPQILGPGFAPSAPASAPVQAEVAEVRGELNILRDLLLERGEAPVAEPAGAAPPADPDLSGRIAELQEVAESIRREISMLQQGAAPAAAHAERPGWNGEPVAAGLSGKAELPAAFPAAAPSAADTGQAAESEAAQTARRLQYLMSELGMDLGTAVAVLQMKPGEPGMLLPAAADPLAPVAAPGQTGPAPAALYQDDVVEQILQELEADTAGQAAAVPSGAALAQAAPEQHQLLSRYFRSVR